MRPWCRHPKAVALAPPGQKTTIDIDGTSQVGTDIVPGTYRSAGGIDCYWARLRSLDTNENIDNSSYVQHLRLGWR